MKNRLISLDVFRGLTVMLMTLVNNPGDWGNVYAPFLHAHWHGWTPTDLVFPFFLFIMGVSVALASPDKKFNDDTVGKILTRTFRILCLGLFLNFLSKINLFGFEGLPLLIERVVLVIIAFALFLGNYDKKLQFYVSLAAFCTFLILAFGGFSDFANVRLPGVLQRIGLVYFFVAIIYFKTSSKTQALIALLLLVGYWLAMTFIPTGINETGNLEAGKNFAAWFDNFFLENHMWATSKIWDPEGLFTTIPAIGTGILGLLTGEFLLSTNQKAIQKPIFLILTGVILTALGIFLGQFFPINKALWTSTFVILTAGLAMIILGILYFLIDILQNKFWTKPFVMFGINPMLVFFFSGVIPRLLGLIKIPDSSKENGFINLQSYIYEYLISPLFADPKAASLAGALTYLLIWTFVLLIFYRKKMIFKV